MMRSITKVSPAISWNSGSGAGLTLLARHPIVDDEFGKVSVSPAGHAVEEAAAGGFASALH